MTEGRRWWGWLRKKSEPGCEEDGPFGKGKAVHQVEIRTKGIRGAPRNRKLWETFYCGWDRASLDLPPDPPVVNGFGVADPELGDYHRMGHAARVLAGGDEGA